MPSAPLTLSALYLYPIKSAGGISLPSSALGPTGLTHDRRWMVVRQDGRLVTQREAPRLKLVQVRLGAEGLDVGAPNMPPLSVSYQPQGARRLADMWGQVMESVSVSGAATEWFSTFLEGDFELVFMPEDVRRLQPEGRPYRSQISFVDGNPFHLITESSLADLNRQLSRPVGAAELRPNLVVSGGEAYQEDYWRRIRVGDLEFEVVESCGRCSVVNVTGNAQVSAEPLRTLARTRRRGQAVPFGQHLVLENLLRSEPLPRPVGQLRVGDMIEVLEVGMTPNPTY